MPQQYTIETPRQVVYIKIMNENELFQWALKQITDAQDAKMYGAITFKFEHGVIVSSSTNENKHPIVTGNKNM